MVQSIYNILHSFAKFYSVVLPLRLLRRGTYILFSFLITLSIDAQTIPYPDNSSATEQFIKWGVPEINQTWTADDFREAFKRLDYVYRLDKFALPRKDSEYSGDLFEHLVDLRHFKPLSNPAIELQERFVLLENLSFIPQKIRSYYAEPQLKTERFGREVLETILLEIQLSQRTLGLVEELRENLRKAGQTNSELTKVYIQAKEELAGVCASLLNIIRTQYGRFEETDIVWFANESADFIQPLLVKLSDKDQDSLLDEVDFMAKKHPNEQVRQVMRGLKR